MLRRFVTASALLLVASAAMAQHKWADVPNKFEITPFIGFGGGAQFQSVLLEDVSYDADSAGIWGVTADFRMGHRAQLEFSWSHMSTEVKTVEEWEGSHSQDLNIDFLHVGWGNWWNYKRVQTFMVTSGGITSYSPDRGDFDTTNYPSLAFGGGTKIPLTQLLGIRVEGKGYATFVSDSDGAFCNQTDGCLMTFDSGVIWTVQGLVGLVFAFD